MDQALHVLGNSQFQQPVEFHVKSSTFLEEFIQALLAIKKIIMTGSRLYDAFRVASGAKRVLGRSLEISNKDCRLFLESSSILRAVFEQNPGLQHFTAACGSDLFKPRPVVRATNPARVEFSAGSTAGTVYEAGKRPTVHQTRSDAGSKREYSTDESSPTTVIGAEEKKDVCLPE